MYQQFNEQFAAASRQFADTAAQINRLALDNATQVFGLQLATQVSTSTPARTGNITLTSAMSLPGSSDPLAGTMDASLVDPAGHALGAPVALQPITGGRFQGKLVFPANATLGTYTLVVHGASSADAGQDLIPVQLGSSALQVKAFNVTATSVARLAHIGAEVRLAYPNGELLGPAKATPSLAFRPASGPAATA